MKRAFFKPVLVILPLLGILSAANSACLACDGWAAYCGWQPQWRLVDDCTRCAWRRTWNGPNALATPLREYFIPRPPRCCSCDGYAAGCGYAVGESYTACDSANCENLSDETRVACPVDASTGFAPVQYERLGQIRNELDIAGPVGAPCPPRAAGR